MDRPLKVGYYVPFFVLENTEPDDGIKNLHIT